MTGNRPRVPPGRARNVEIKDFFHGYALNAVDAKGRVSVPASFRSVIERRARRALLPGEVVANDRILLIGEHERASCLQAFDPTYSQMLFAQIEKRVDAMGGEVDALAALDDAQLDAFGAANEINYDERGGVVLSPSAAVCRRGSGGLAWFVGAGATFQIWEPARFLKDGQDKPRLIRALENTLSDKGIAL